MSPIFPRVLLIPSSKMLCLKSSRFQMVLFFGFSKTAFAAVSGNILTSARKFVYGKTAIVRVPRVLLIPSSKMLCLKSSRFQTLQNLDAISSYRAAHSITTPYCAVSKKLRTVMPSVRISQVSWALSAIPTVPLAASSAGSGS